MRNPFAIPAEIRRRGFGSLGSIRYQGPDDIDVALGIPVDFDEVNYHLVIDDITGLPSWEENTGGGSGASTVSELTDVDLTGLGDQFLFFYDDASSTWIVRLLQASDIPDLSATYIPKSLIDAKGDILAGTADNTVVRKAVGTDNKVLVADSTQTDGLDWRSINSTTRTYWEPFQPFTSPASQDDELESDKTTFDARYTLVNWAGLTSYDVVRGKLIALAPVSNLLQRHALYPLPSGDFTIWTHVTLEGAFTGGPFFAGLGLSDGTTNGAGNQVFAFEEWDNANTRFTRGCNRYTNFTGASAATLKTAEGSDGHVFIRLRRSGTNYFVAFSNDGIDWDESSAFTLTWVATWFGFAMRADTGSVNARATWDFIRYVASTSGVLGESITLGLAQEGQPGPTGPAGKGGIVGQFGDGAASFSGFGYRSMAWAAFDGVITEIRLKNLDTAGNPANATVTVDIFKNGTTIFTSVAKLTLTASSSDVRVVMTGIDTLVSEGDEFQFYIVSSTGSMVMLVAQLFVDRV